MSNINQIPGTDQFFIIFHLENDTLGSDRLFSDESNAVNGGIIMRLLYRFIFDGPISPHVFGDERIDAFSMIDSNTLTRINQMWIGDLTVLAPQFGPSPWGI